MIFQDFKKEISAKLSCEIKNVDLQCLKKKLGNKKKFCEKDVMGKKEKSVHKEKNS